MKELHPDDMSFENRKRCLYDLKEIWISDRVQDLGRFALSDNGIHI